MGKNFNEWVKLRESVTTSGLTLQQVTDSILENLERLNPYLPDERVVVDQLCEIALGHPVGIGQEILHVDQMVKSIKQMQNKADQYPLVHMWTCLNSN